MQKEITDIINIKFHEYGIQDANYELLFKTALLRRDIDFINTVLEKLNIGKLEVTSANKQNINANVFTDKQQKLLLKNMYITNKRGIDDFVKSIPHKFLPHTEKHVCPLSNVETNISCDKETCHLRSCSYTGCAQSIDDVHILASATKIPVHKVEKLLDSAVKKLRFSIYKNLFDYTKRIPKYKKGCVLCGSNIENNTICSGCISEKGELGCYIENTFNVKTKDFLSLLASTFPSLTSIADVFNFNEDDVKRLMIRNKVPLPIEDIKKFLQKRTGKKVIYPTKLGFLYSLQTLTGINKNILARLKDISKN